MGGSWIDQKRHSSQPPENLLQQRSINTNQDKSDNFWGNNQQISPSAQEDIYIESLDDQTSDQLVSDFGRNVFGSGSSTDVASSIENNTDRFISTQQIPTQSRAKVKAAILLPLSGQHKEIGQSLLNAAQLALFDLAGDYFELTPRDTKSTAQGAQQAAYSAIQEGVSVIIGPLFADSVRAIQPMAKRSGIPIISFSTDWTVADYQTFLMGFMPFDQVQRVMSYAASQGLTQQAIIAPYTPYGDVVTNAFRQTARQTNANAVMIERYRSGDDNFNDLARKFTRYDERLENLQLAIDEIEAIPEKQRTEYQKNELARLQILHTVGDLPFDAVLLPIGGTEAKSVTSILKYYDVDLSKARFLGTGLWDDPSVFGEVSMLGGWYTAPAPEQRLEFEQKYKDIYGSPPPRLASLGFDATALVAVLSRNPNSLTENGKLKTSILSDPNGFMGIDGIFRFSRNGLIERGMAVLEISPEGPKVVSPAPLTFQSQQF